jgi:hypothetical protein
MAQTNEIIKYENYPARTVVLSNTLSVFIYLSGFYVMMQPGWIASLLYLLYILALEFRVVKYHCVNCFYFGKTCGFGKGKLSALFFKKGESARFCANEMTWKDMIPDILVSLIPLITGIVLLIIHFDFFVLAALILLIFLSTKGNEVIRGSYTCNHCIQKDLGCPADKLFNKQK